MPINLCDALRPAMTHANKSSLFPLTTYTYMTYSSGIKGAMGLPEKRKTKNMKSTKRVAITKSKSGKSFSIRVCRPVYRTPTGGHGTSYESGSVLVSGFASELDARNQAGALGLNVVWPVNSPI